MCYLSYSTQELREQGYLSENSCPFEGHFREVPLPVAWEGCKQVKAVCLASSPVSPPGTASILQQSGKGVSHFSL